VYRSVEKYSPGTTNTLVMGPCFHGGWSRGDGDHLGSVEFFQKTSEFYRKNIELPFLNRYLKGQTKADPLPKAYVFETGSNRWPTDAVGSPVTIETPWLRTGQDANEDKLREQMASRAADFIVKLFRKYSTEYDEAEQAVQ